MENLLFFLHIIAWPVAVGGTILGCLTLYSAWHYEGSMTELQDKLRGQRRTFHPFKLLIPAFIAWAFIIAF